MKIFASKHDGNGPLYIAATLSRSELVDALAKAGLPVADGMTLENVRFNEDQITIELSRSADAATEPNP